MLYLFDLQLFAEAGAAAGAATSTSEGAALDAGVQSGEQPSQSEQKRISLSELIKTDPDAKKEFDSILGRRLKKADEQKARLDKWTEIAPILAQSYDLAEDDLDHIIENVKNDTSFFKKKAVADGITTDEAAEKFRQLQENRKRENELKAYKEQEAERKRREATIAQWQKEIPELLRKYPQMDPRVEVNDEQFCRLLDMGLSFSDAYELRHKEEIRTAEREKALAEAAETVAANRTRPTEAGLAKTATPLYQESPKGYSKEKIDEIKKLSFKGVKVRLPHI